MKAKLIFNLPDDRDDFKAATAGMDYFMALFDMDNFLMATERGKNTVIEEASSKDDIVEVIQNRFYEILDYWDISMDEIS